MQNLQPHRLSVIWLSGSIHRPRDDAPDGRPDARGQPHDRLAGVVKGGRGPNPKCEK